MKALLERVFEGSWQGATSSEVDNGKEETCRLVDRMFCCCPRWWPRAVAMEGFRCLMIRSEVRPGQEVKCPFLMARTRVDVTGLNSVPWRKDASSVLVALDRIALEAIDVDTGAPVVIDEMGLMGAKGMCHRPLGVRGPWIIILPFLIILTLYFVNRAAQSSSHNLLIEIREPVESPSRT